MTEQQIASNLIWQIPLASLIVFLTLRFLAYLREMNKQNGDAIQAMSETIERINSKNQDAETDRQKAVLDFISRQEETNREFLKIQREQMNEAISRLAEEIKGNRIENVKEIGNVVSLISKVMDKINDVTEKLQNITFMNIQQSGGKK